MVQGVTLAHKGLAPSRLISYFRKRKMPMLGTHIVFLQAGMKLLVTFFLSSDFLYFILERLLV